MGNSSSTNKDDDGEITCRIGGGNICGGRAIHEILKNHTMNEIVLSKTYSYPKGTFTIESTKYLNENEKALYHFCKGNNIAAIRYLTIKGVHINTLDQDRTSPLHVVCKSASLQLVEEVINQGAMINMPDIVGWTPLHVACYYKRSEVILLLLKHGANLNIKNRDGLFPIDLIDKDVKCRDIISNFILHSYGSKIASREIILNKYKNAPTNVHKHSNNKIPSHANSDENDNSIDEFDCSNTDSQNKSNIIDIDKYLTNDVIANDSNYVSEFNPNLHDHKSIEDIKNICSVIRLKKNEREFDEKQATIIQNFDKENIRNLRKSEVNPLSVKNEKSGYKTLNHFSKNKIDLPVVNNLNYSFISANSDYIRINTSDDFKNEEKLIKSKQILDRYKVVPKKHKFYETYKNGFNKNKNSSEIININKSNLNENRKNSDIYSNSKKVEEFPLEISKKNKSKSVLSSENRKNRRRQLIKKEVDGNNYKADYLGKNPFERASDENNFTNSKDLYNNRNYLTTHKNSLTQSCLIKIPNAFPDTYNVDKINLKNSQIIEMRNSHDQILNSKKNILIKSNCLKPNNKIRTRSNSFDEENNLNYKAKSINNMKKSNPINNIKNFQSEKNPKIPNYKSKDYIFKCDKNFNVYANNNQENTYKLKENLLLKSSANFQTKSVLKDNNIPNYQKHIPYYNIDSDCEKYQIYNSFMLDSEDSFIIDESIISKDNYTINYPKQKGKEGSIYIYRRYLKEESDLKSKNYAMKNYQNQDKDKFNTDKSQEFILNTSDEDKSGKNDITLVNYHVPPAVWQTNPHIETEVDNSYILSEEIAIAVMKTVKKYKNQRNPLSLAESVPNLRNKKDFDNTFIYNANKNNTISKKIIENSEFENFLKKIILSEIFFEIFEISRKEMENILTYMYLIDPKFALLFTINLYKIENKYENIPILLKKEISDKFLRGLVLLSNYENEELNKNIFTHFFESFEYSQTNFIHYIKKIFKCFTFLNSGDFLKIDEISKIMANCFYKSSANKNSVNKSYLDNNNKNINNSQKIINLNESNRNEFDKIFKSEHAVYMLLFTLIVTDVNLNSQNSKGIKEFHIPSKEFVNKNYYDLLIVLKDLNDGKNFNNSYLKEYFNYIKVMGIVELPDIVCLNNILEELKKGKMNVVRIFKNGKYKENNYILLKQGFMLLLKNKSKNVSQNNFIIDKVLFLKYDQFYHYRYNYDEFSLYVESKQNRKTILIFSNENNNIGYSKYSSIRFQFHNLENLKNAEKIFSSK